MVGIAGSGASDAQSPVGSGRAAARAVGAFFDELVRCGVRHVVVAPGSRSTPLAMVAYELSRRTPEKLQVHIDVDERGAAFVALGIGKATGVPACVVCTSGTAVANFYPAVMEAESSRVPLLVLTGDRPASLQGLGAPQTCDQLNAYGNHVAAFRQMPAFGPSERDAALARQAAREAMIATGGGAGVAEAATASASLAAKPSQAALPIADGQGAPVHFNFPFDEPLTPDLSDAALFSMGRREEATADAAPTAVPVRDDVVVPCVVHGRSALTDDDARAIATLLAGKRAMVLAGEGSVRDTADADALLAWAHAIGAPVVADPLSNLRCFDDPLVIDNYDNVFARANWPHPAVVVRFGRWPVSKRTSTALAAARPMQIVVDRMETRDFNAATDLFVACDPWEFVRAVAAASEQESAVASDEARAFAEAWIAANDEERARVEAADAAEAGVEGAFVRAVVDAAPEGSQIFAASSMSVRAFDTFYTKRAKRLRLLCNRGLNGIDGTVSSAVGAAIGRNCTTTLVIGDLALLHDVNALALQRELVGPPAAGSTSPSPAVVVVLLNNNGGAIFDMLPQQSDDAYFERLFLTPQDVSFGDAAGAFGVPYQRVVSVDEFRSAYEGALGTSGLSLIEVELPLQGVKERYGRYW